MRETRRQAQQSKCLNTLVFFGIHCMTLPSSPVCHGTRCVHIRCKGRCRNVISPMVAPRALLLAWRGPCPTQPIDFTLTLQTLQTWGIFLTKEARGEWPARNEEAVEASLLKTNRNDMMAQYKPLRDSENLNVQHLLALCFYRCPFVSLRCIVLSSHVDAAIWFFIRLLNWIDP